MLDEIDANLSGEESMSVQKSFAILHVVIKFLSFPINPSSHQWGTALFNLQR